MARSGHFSLCATQGAAARQIRRFVCLCGLYAFFSKTCHRAFLGASERAGIPRCIVRDVFDQIGGLTVQQIAQLCKDVH